MTTSGLECLQKLGSGTYGRVYKAKREDGQAVAVKRIISTKYSSFVESIREADILVRCCGKTLFITNVLGITFANPFNKIRSPPPTDHRDGNLNLIMYKARGNLYEQYQYPDVKKFLQSNVVEIFSKILLGLNFLHSYNIAHRDIKPENVLVFWEDPTPEDPTKHIRTLNVEISDLGMAMPLSSVNSTQIQTFLYRAPEVACDCPFYNTSIDIWSAGILLYFLITGAEPLKSTMEDNQSCLAEINKFLPLSDQKYPMASNKLQPLLPKIFNRVSIGDSLKQFHMRGKWPGEIPFEPTVALIKRMIILDHHRPTAKELLSDPWFESQKDLITTHLALTPMGYETHQFSTVVNDVRVTACNIFIDIFNDCCQSLDKWPWFEDRILFLALDLIDRYVSYNKDNVDFIPLPEGILYPENNQRQIKIYLLVNSCLYIAIKYFTDRATPLDRVIGNISYTKAPWVEYLAKLEQHLLLSVFNFVIYRPNIYEISTNQSHQNASKLFSFMVKQAERCQNLTPVQILKLIVKDSKTEETPL